MKPFVDDAIAWCAYCVVMRLTKSVGREGVMARWFWVEHKKFIVRWFLCLGLVGGLLLETVASSWATPALQADFVVDLVQTGQGGTAGVIRGALAFRVRTFDSTVGQRDGDGIANVDLIVLDPDGNEVYRRRESTAGYCAFGGGEPNCTVYVFADHDNAWPNGEPIRDGENYRLRAEVHAKDGSSTAAGWDVQLQLGDSSDLVVNLLQTGRNGTATQVRNALVFRISATDPTMGGRDGDGIAGVDMIILDPEGDEVYRKRETSAGYCAFGGGTPACGVYTFARNGNRWPDRNGERGDPIRRGEQYTLRAEVEAEDGRSTTFDTVIVIR